MSPDVAPHRATLRLAFATTLALVWGTMAGEPLPGLTAVLVAQILVGMPQPPRLGQAVALVTVILATGGVAFAVGSDVTVDARYLHGFALSGANPKDRITLGANFHF